MTDDDPIEDTLALTAIFAGLSILLGVLIGVGLLVSYAYTEASWFGLFALFFGGGILVLGVAGMGRVFYRSYA